MPTLLVRPTRKRIIAGYFVCLCLCAAWGWVYYTWLQDKPRWLAALGVLVFAWPIWADISNRFTSLKLENGRLSFRTGMGKISTRVLDVAKVRDVHVEQGILQRMLGIGSIAVDTMGESGRIVMVDIDHPQQVANDILDSCRHYQMPGTQIIEDKTPNE